jgi:ABC-type polysaccharide/polyol phosphate export permease
MFTFVWRTVFRNAINLAHNLVIIVGVLIYFGYWRTMNVPVALIGLALLFLNAAWAGMLAGIASARFRDIPQIVISVMQFAIFMTPVFWPPSQLGNNRVFLDVNPFYHMLEAVRTPLMGGHVAPHSYSFLTLMALFGWGLTFFVFTRTRRRIVHYL